MFFIIFCIFLILKLCGAIAWSWWWVASPLWIGSILWVCWFAFLAWVWDR
jgi:hypothetical protein